MRKVNKIGQACRSLNFMSVVLVVVLGSAMAFSANIATDHKYTLVNTGSLAGQTAVNSTGVDMTGYYGCAFVVQLGVVDATGTGTAIINGSADNVTYTDLTGSSVAWTATDDDKVVIVEVTNPLLRYVRVELTRATADSTIDGILAIQHGASVMPVTQPATVVGVDVVDGV